MALKVLGIKGPKKAVPAARVGKYYPADDVEKPSQNPSIDHTWNCTHSSCRTLSWKACCVPKIVGIWTHSCLWTLSCQWSTTSSCESHLHHCHRHKSRCIQ